jgi:hypothetical protein
VGLDGGSVSSGIASGRGFVSSAARATVVASPGHVAVLAFFRAVVFDAVQHLFLRMPAVLFGDMLSQENSRRFAL